MRYEDGEEEWVPIPDADIVFGDTLPPFTADDKKKSMEYELAELELMIKEDEEEQRLEQARMYLSLSIYLTLHLHIHPSIYPSVYSFISLSIYLPIYLSIYLSICLSIYPSIYLSMKNKMYIDPENKNIGHLHDFRKWPARLRHR